MGLSSRTAWDLSANALAARVDALRASGRPHLDLAESNPTRVGLAWDPAELAAVLADRRVATYEPTPVGLPEAREAVAEYLAARGAPVDAGRILLTASTSEAYALLFKLLCDPGDEVLVPAPAYPLLDLLADLEAVRLVRYPLRDEGGWHLDLAALEAAIGPRTRAVLVVSPSNPTGAVHDAAELAALDRLCAANDLALLGDEVFADTALGPCPSVVAGRREALAFHLAGLSKICGLPQLKAAWIAAAGPEARVGPALARLEVVADAYLSVSGPAQLALAPLLARRERFLAPLRARLAANRATLADLRDAPVGALPSAGGWTAVLRIGQTVDEEALCLALLDDGVVVQPGFFYDFERPGHLVISLLPQPHELAQGIGRVIARCASGDFASPSG
ncbi:pyridoxal phosphate-dependent aminotransferase [Anaeromyxobacter sp. Fw109-5]|uniref:pyridoxal phosphate-dependent aminotransferase n=1 Tax=Anaeromyxobacter sp. (strain Fw109-5) TaxID=404589 RepID=UPI0000ED7180|nr:pyridoxal phosphate-dependent aminotransferase [Anaeromyxobacter sp. Fw109-5]ABS27594.1 aminotransferase class I and II [Anaeromyxobacter sp. Fw109-5]